MSNNSPAFARFFLTLPPEDGLRRARLLNWITRALSVLAIALGSILLLAPFARPAVADAIASILLLSALAITAFCVFRAQAHDHHQAATVCLNLGLALTISLAVWQFGRRVPEVHLGYFIPIALAAMLWGSVPALVTALSVWAANVVIVANQPGATPTFYRVEEIVGLLTLGASYVSLAIVVGRFAENLADAVSRSKQNALAAEQAEKQARASADELAITLEAEQAHRQELGTLYNLASRLAATSKLEDLLPFTAESIVSALQVTFATIALLEQNDQEGAPRLVIASCYPCRETGENLGIGEAIGLNELPTLATALQRQACCVVQREGILNLSAAETKFLRAADLASLGIVPIFVENKPLGAIILGEGRAPARAPLNDEKMQLAQSISDLTAGAIQRSRLFDELEDAYVQTVLALAKAVEAKDTYTADHAERLAAMAENVARALGEANPAELRALRFGAMLHDVGKIGVPDSILKKPARLTDEEWKEMRQHPVIGGQILETVARLRGAARVVRHHHERWDGKGYPDGLLGDAIPLGARILTVVDSYSAIVDARVYKAARTHAEAVAELQRGAGSQFDPQVVAAFLRISGDGTMEAEAAQRSRELAAPLPELQTIQKMIDAVGGTLDLRQVLREAARTAVESLDAAATGIFLYDADSDTLLLAEENGLPVNLKTRFRRFPVKGFHNEQVVREARVRLHGSPADVPEFVDLEIPQQQPDWGNYLCVPLTAKGQVLGIMGIFSRRPRVFNDRDLTLYRALGEQIGLAISNARAHEVLQLLAITDGLTGVFNRRYFDGIMTSEVERCARYRRTVSLIMLDVDHFKAYNDSFGHPAGDVALRQVADLIQANVRASDVVTRYGGEEFAIVLAETDAGGAQAAAEKIRAAIHQHAFVHGNLTASLGVAECNGKVVDSPENLVTMADQALYRAKDAGRNRVVVWEADLTALPRHHDPA